MVFKELQGSSGFSLDDIEAISKTEDGCQCCRTSCYMFPDSLFIGYGIIEKLEGIKYFPSCWYIQGRSNGYEGSQSTFHIKFLNLLKMMMLYLRML